MTLKEDLHFSPKGLELAISKTSSVNDLKALDTATRSSSLNNIGSGPNCEEDSEDEEQLLFFMDEEAEVKRDHESVEEREYWEIGINN